MTIKEIRKQVKMTRTDFAKYLNIPYETMSNWELGRRECPAYLIELIWYKVEHENLIKQDESAHH